MAYPTDLDSLERPSKSPMSNTVTVSHVDLHNNTSTAVEAIQAKVGIDDSAVATSLDYLVKNTSSSDPGHKHTLANGATDVTASAADLNQLDGVTLPTGDIVGTTDTQTLTNKTLTSPTVTSATVDEQTSTSAFTKHYGVKDLGTVGATETVDWDNGDRQKMTLDENVTITFSNASEGQTLTLYMLQDGTGTNTITFSDTIVWADNTTPAWTTTADKWNIAIITYVGGEYLGVGNAFA
jgi:hypothetical protein